MALWVGTSGYNYDEWKGGFYPEKIAGGQMLPYYAQRLSTVEINYTYYRMPNAKTLQGWDDATPNRFKLTLKAPKRITHEAKLRDCADSVRYFTDTAAKLGPKLGALLFQLPPSLRQNLPLLDAFLETLPDGTCAAFEFRHGSWLNAEVYARLRARNLALCVADSATMATPLVLTADYAYFRLRDEGYSPEDIAGWAARIGEATGGCKEVYVYFKHEEAGLGPQFAGAFLEAWAGESSGP
jgi:uncharacterized protein YecE (DUF72 family)